MATVTSAFSDLPEPPYSHPEDYEALVDAMVQELYRLNPEWVERKQRLQKVICFYKLTSDDTNFGLCDID